MNKCIFIGRITKDIETRQAGETVVASFSIALDTGYGDKKKTSFLNCVAFGKTAENIAKYFSKGNRIGLETEAQQNVWEDKEGKKHYDVNFVVRSFEFVESKKEASESSFESIEGIQEDLPFK